MTVDKRGPTLGGSVYIVPEQTKMIGLTPRIVDGGDVGVAGRRVRVIYDRYQLTYQLTASLIWWPHSQPLGEYVNTIGTQRHVSDPDDRVCADGLAVDVDA